MTSTAFSKFARLIAPSKYRVVVDQPTIKNSIFTGVFIKKGNAISPEDHSHYQLLGYFESFADASLFAHEQHEKGYDVCYLDYNPSKTV